MPETSGLEPCMNIPFPVEAVIEGPRLKIQELMALSAGSVVPTAVAAGANVEVRAGKALIGTGELAAMAGTLIVRMLTFCEKE